MRARGMVRYFGLVALAYVVTTLGTGLTDYLTATEVGKTKSLVISASVGLAVALILGGIDLAKGGGQQESARQSPQGTGGSMFGLLLGGLLLLALCAGGGYLVTTGVQAAVSKLEEVAAPPWETKTREPGVQRLAQEVSKRAGPLTITVLSVEVNSEVTMVKVRARNSGADALTIPTFMNAQLTLPNRTLQPDPAAGDWPGQVPAEGEAVGTIVFDGALDPVVTSVKLSFSTIYGSFDAPRNIAVQIPLR